MVEKLLSGFQSEQKKERRKGEAMRVGIGVNLIGMFRSTVMLLLAIVLN